MKKILAFSILTLGISFIGSLFLERDTLHLQTPQKQDLASKKSINEVKTIQSVTPEDEQVSIDHIEAQVKNISSTNDSDESLNGEDSLFLPEPIDVTTRDAPSELTLWQRHENKGQTSVDGLPATKFSMDPASFTQLKVDQTLKIDLPHKTTATQVRLVETRNNIDGTEIWRGQIENEPPQSTFIISRGKKQTHIIIATEQASYTVVVDNHSGLSTLIDESQITSRMAPINDGIVFQPASSN